MWFPPKVLIDSDTDQDIPPHIPILEDHCRTCLTEKVKCSCQPMSDWSGELIDITQLDPPHPDNNKNRDDAQDQTLPLIGETKTIYGWVRPMTKLGPNHL